MSLVWIILLDRIEEKCRRIINLMANNSQIVEMRSYLWRSDHVVLSGDANSSAPADCTLVFAE